MGYAARKNAALRAQGKTPTPHIYTNSGPAVARSLRLTDESGREIYRVLPWGQAVRVAPKRA